MQSWGFNGSIRSKTVQEESYQLLNLQTFAANSALLLN